MTSLNVLERKAGFNIDTNHKNESTSIMENMNFKMDVIGGDIEKKDDYNGWLKGLNLDNYEIIRYESVIPIHDYFDEELKNEIENLLERENERILLEKQKEEEEIAQEIKEDNVHIDQVVANPVTIMVLGDNDSGKTSLIKRYLNQEFNSMEKNTVSQEYYSYIDNFRIDKKIFKIKIQLVDNPVNSQRLNEMDLSYIRHCDGIILIADVSNVKTKERLYLWGDAIKDNLKKQNIPIFLIPNKSDLNKKVDKLNEIAEKYEMTLLNDISCKDSNKHSILKEQMNFVIINSYQNKEKKVDKIVYRKRGFCS